jgi:hypothetical protein
LDEDGPAQKTVFVLFLSLDNLGYAKLKQSLQSLDGEMLLFLKQLCSLYVDIEGTVSSHARFSDNDQELARIETRRNRSTYVKQFIFLELVWKDMPHHDKRPGKQTKTSLAFPYSSTGPLIRPDNFIYAYLPMQKMQFKVLLNQSAIS